MGAYTPVPWFGQREMEEVVDRVFEPIAWRMDRDGTPYRGVLYAGLMLTDAGPMVLEFNARFGDPEAQVLLPLLDGDLAAAMLGVATGDRGAMEGALGPRAGAAAVGVVLASEGYPDRPVSGRPLAGAEPSSPADGGPRLCFHAGTRADRDGGTLATGGRVVTFVGLAADHAAARAEAYAALAESSLEGGQQRTDIAAEVR
jgi:phosphoribosylamine--glycine ligase